ncbi:MAG: polyamine ABC transporter substrate-binding protein [Firmicutes bacterium]|nr:polyamine ABC transporter substrate-binding protein [Bacillota bacterium]
MTKLRAIRGVFVLLAAALLVGLAIAGSGETALAATRHVLRVGSGVADVGTLDPHFATNFGEYPIVKAMFNGLVDLPPGTVDLERIEPDLAESWSVSDDGRIWTFHLRRGVQFHHGYGELTSEDVVFSFQRVADPEVGSPWRSEVSNIKEVRAVDRYTVEIELHAPDPFALLRLVGYHSGFIVSKKAVEELGDQHRFRPIGTGPFAIAEYNPRRSVVLVANDEYFKGKPKLAGIEFLFMPDTATRELALRRQEVDTADGDSEQIWVDRMRSQGIVVDMVGPGNGYFVQFNMTKPPFDNLKVRQALAYAVNRDEIVQYLGPALARPLKSPVPAGYFGHTTDGIETYEYDPERAKQLLAEAGYPNGFEFEIYISEATSYLPFAQILQEHWRRIGVTMRLNVIDHASYHARIREDANSVIFYNATRLPIADVYLSQFYHSDAIVGKPTAITNFSHLGDVVDNIDDLIEEARFEMNPERQKELYAEAQRRIMAVAAAMPYAQRYSATARQPYVDLGYELIGPNRLDNLFEHYIYNEKTNILR